MQIGNALFAIGVAYLLSLLAARLFTRIQIPRVTAYLIVGLLVGPSAATLFDYPQLLSTESVKSIQVLSDLALALIMVIIGSNFKLESLRRWGRRLGYLSVTETAMTCLFVTVAIFLCNWLITKSSLNTSLGLMGSSLYMALFTGVISVATAPAATLLVIREYESDGLVTDLVYALIGLNNFISIFTFNVLIFFLINTDNTISILLLRLFGPLLFGAAIGIFVSLWVQRLESELEALILIMGSVVAAIGLSQMLQIDLFLTCFMMGATIVNASPKANVIFASIRRVDYPLYVIFFIIAGASLHIDALAHLGILGATYVVMRIAGKVLGSWLGAKLAAFGQVEQRWLGYAMLAQAGVAIGLSQTLARAWPEGGHIIQTLILGSVVIFELVGPLAVRQSLIQAGEVPVLTQYRKRNPESATRGFHHVLHQFRQSLGVPEGHEIESAEDILVEHVMRRNIEVIEQDTPFNELLRLVSHSKYDRFPIVNGNGEYIGVLDYADIRDLIFDTSLKNILVARDLVKPAPLQVYPKQTLGDVLGIFQKHSNISYLPVVEKEESKKLLGLISQNDVLAAFHIPKPETPLG